MLNKYFIRSAHRRGIGSVMPGYSDSSGSDAGKRSGSRAKFSGCATEKVRSLRITQDQARDRSLRTCNNV
jgi:hypothetical protein